MQKKAPAPKAKPAKAAAAAAAAPAKASGPKIDFMAEVLANLKKDDIKSGGDGTKWEKKMEDEKKEKADKAAAAKRAASEAAKKAGVEKAGVAKAAAAKPSGGGVNGLVSGMQGMRVAESNQKPAKGLAKLELSQKSDLPAGAPKGNGKRMPLQRAPATTPVVASRRSAGDQGKGQVNSRQQGFGAPEGFGRRNAAGGKPPAPVSQRRGVDSPASKPTAGAQGTAKDSGEGRKGVSIPNKPGWEVAAAANLMPLVKGLGGGLKTKSICTSLVKQGYARVMDMLNKPHALKEAYQQAKAGPANAQLLSRIGQGRVRVPAQPNNQHGNFGRNNNRNNNNRNHQGNRGGGGGGQGGRNSMPSMSSIVWELPPPAIGTWVPKAVDTSRVKTVSELKAICEESKFCREKPAFLMGLNFIPTGQMRKPSHRQRAMEQLMNKPLLRSENAWKPNSKKKVADEDPLAVLKKKVNAGLNKLTRENEKKILDSILAMKVSDLVCLEALVSLVFEKAITQAYLGDVYADFAVRLSTATSEWQQNIIKTEAREDGKFYFNAGYSGTLEANVEGGPYDTKEKALKQGKKRTDFQRMLLQKCQTKFEAEEKYQAAAAQEDNDAKDMTAAEKRARAREQEQDRKSHKKNKLGNINFIGELYKKEMLPPVVLTGCIDVLLPKDGEDPEEDSIEMCCKLLTSVGQNLDRQGGGKGGKRNKRGKDGKDSGKKKNKPSIQREDVDAFYTKLTAIRELETLPARVNFQILDLIDLRNSRWKERRKKVVAKTKDEIKKEFEREERQKEMESRRSGGYNNRRNNDDRRQGRSSMGNGDIRSRGKQDKRGGDNKGKQDNRGSRRSSGSSSSNNSRDAPKERPKLNLKKKSVSNTPTQEARKAPVTAAQWPQEKVDRDIKATLKEYLSIQKFEELKLNVLETKQNSGSSKINASLVACIFSLFLDMKDKDRESLTKLISTLLKPADGNPLVAQKEFLASVNTLAAELPDLKFDAPKCDEWFGALFGTLIAEKSVTGLKVMSSLKPVFADVFNGQLIARLSLTIIATVKSLGGDLSDEGIHKMFRSGLVWLLRMARMSAAERMLGEAPGVFSGAMPGFEIALNFSKQKATVTDTAELCDWLRGATSGLNKKSLDQGDVAFGVTAAVLAGSESKTEISADAIEILKTVVDAQGDTSNEGCCDAVHNIGLCNSLKNEDIVKMLEALVKAGVLKQSVYLGWKDWNM